MNPAQTQARAAGTLYALLADALSFPCQALAEMSRSGELRGTVAANSALLGLELRAPLGALDLAGEAKELEAEYIRLFELPGKTPTPLYAGVYAVRRRDAMEELLRFYRFFGLTTEGGTRDLPDFVPVLLEFLGFLSFGQVAANPSTRQSRAAAQMDILSRHLHPWAVQTLSRLGQREPSPFYHALVAVVRDISRDGTRDCAGSLSTEEIDHPVRI